MHRIIHPWLPTMATSYHLVLILDYHNASRSATPTPCNHARYQTPPHTQHSVISTTLTYSLTTETNYHG
jgi:hypothetical protein